MARRKKVKVDKPIQMIVLVILVVVAVYLYFQNPQDEPEITYSASQNAEGFYYYTDVPDGTYYSTANQMTANTLLLELRSIINEDITRRSYDEVRYDLETVDLMLNSTTQLYGVYDNALLNATWDGGATWNREHVWPNSR